MLRKQQVAQQQLERQLIAQLGTSSNGPDSSAWFLGDTAAMPLTGSSGCS
jgi:hypothetical protein